MWLTYTCYLSFVEDATQHEHLDGDGEEEDKGESQRRLGGHDGPEDGQAYHLDAGEEMHAPRTNLMDTNQSSLPTGNVHFISVPATDMKHLYFDTF